MIYSQYAVAMENLKHIFTVPERLVTTIIYRTVTFQIFSIRYLVNIGDLLFFFLLQ